MKQVRGDDTMTQDPLAHPLVRDYLRQLDSATAALPADERQDIRESITAHLSEALAGATSDADVRNALHTLGDPYDIVGAPPVAEPPAQRGVMEILAVVLLLMGFFIVPVVGWFVGVVLLWSSKAWTTGQKWLGTLVLPGGLAAVFLIWLVPVTLFSSSCMATSMSPVGGGPETVISTCENTENTLPPFWLVASGIAVAIMAPVGSAIYLLRTAGRRPSRP